MREILEILGYIILIIGLAIIIIMALAWGIVKLNIACGPYEGIDLDGNEVMCIQTWRNNGILYGITEKGESIYLKSYKSLKGADNIE